MSSLTIVSDIIVNLILGISVRHAWASYMNVMCYIYILFLIGDFVGTFHRMLRICSTIAH